MEVFSNTTDKRTVLYACTDRAEMEELRRNLESSFNLVCCSTAKEALSIMTEQFNGLSATVIDIEFARANNFSFLHSVAQERYLDTIPVVVVTAGNADGEDVRCLERGAVDVLELPCHPALVKQRIDNAVQLRRSSTFYEIESMLHVLPSMIFLKDAEGRYVFSTQYWHHLEMGDDPKWTIRGKTDVDIRKDKENALKAMEADKEIIRTGKGTSYVIEINADGVTDFIQLIKEPVFDEYGNVTGIIALGNDVTEFELLKRKLQRYAHIDELTGLGNRRAFDEFVETIPTLDCFPIAVISADCDSLKAVNDEFGHHMGDEYLHMTANILQAGIPDNQLAFRVGGDEFVAFLLGATEEQANEVVDSMRHKADWFKLKNEDAIASYGISIIESPDDDIQGLLQLADERMYAEKAEHKRARREQMRSSLEDSR